MKTVTSSTIFMRGNQEISETKKYCLKLIWIFTIQYFTSLTKWNGRLSFKTGLGMIQIWIHYSQKAYSKCD